MITEKDLIPGETVLARGGNADYKRLYLGNAGLVHFISAINKYECVGGHCTIEELNDLYTIEQPKSKVVPLEKKVYDFVPVIARDMVSVNWKNTFLIAVTPGTEFPFKTVDEYGNAASYRHCEFINEQQP